MTDAIAAEKLRSYVDRVLRLREEIAALNADVSEVYKEAVGNGFDRKILQATVKRAAQPAEAVQEHDTLLDLYWRAYIGAPSRARARTREEYEGEIAHNAAADLDALRADIAGMPKIQVTEPVTPHDADGVVIETPAAVEANAPVSAAEPQKSALQSVEAHACIPVQQHTIHDIGDIPACLDRRPSRAAGAVA